MGGVLATLIVLGSFDHRFGGGESGTLSVSLAEAFAYIAALLVVLELVADPPPKRRGILHRLVARGWACFAYVAWAAIAGVAAYAKGGSIEGLHALKDFMPGVILFSLMCAWIARRAALERAQTSMLVCVSIMSLLCMAQYLAGGPYLAPLSENAYFKHSFDTIDIVRHPVVGMFGHPNGAAMFFVPALLLSVGLLAKRRTAEAGRGGLPLSMVGVLSALGLALTQAKIAIVVGVVGSACVVFLERRGVPYSLKRCVVGFVVLGVLVAGLIAGVITFLESRGVAIATGTLVTRWYLAAIAVESLRTHPWVALVGGSGVSNAGLGVGLAVHNTFIANALEHGVLGAILYASIFWKALSLPSRHGWSYAFPLLGLVALELVEPALGAQMEMLVLFYAGLAAVSAVVERPDQVGGNVLAPLSSQACPLEASAL